MFSDWSRLSNFLAYRDRVAFIKSVRQSKGADYDSIDQTKLLKLLGN